MLFHPTNRVLRQSSQRGILIRWLSASIGSSTEDVPRLRGTSLKWTRLPERTLLRVSGPDTLPFLQGLVTNDTSYLSPGPQKQHALYTFMLNTSGRVLHDLLIYEFGQGNDHDYMVECSKEGYEDLTHIFIKYRMRKKVDFHSCSDTITVCAIYPNYERSFDFQFDKDIADEIILPPTTADAKASRKAVAFCADPRLFRLGARFLAHTAEPIGDYMDVAEEGSPEEYQTARYALGMAEGPQEIIPGKALPLEYNGDYLNGISFHKGCYIGQELTARSHHVGVIRKRIMPLQFEMRLDSPLPMDSKVINQDGDVIGRLKGFAGKFGIALMRVDQALKAEKVFLYLEEGEKKLPCNTWTPTWWNLEQELGQVRGFQPQGAES